MRKRTVLVIEFDGSETVWCPVGDFFGSGVGINPRAVKRYMFGLDYLKLDPAD